MFSSQQASKRPRQRLASSLEANAGGDMLTFVRIAYCGKTVVRLILIAQQPWYRPLPPFHKRIYPHTEFKATLSTLTTI